MEVLHPNWAGLDAHKSLPSQRLGTQWWLARALWWAAQ